MTAQISGDYRNRCGSAAPFGGKAAPFRPGVLTSPPPAPAAPINWRTAKNEDACCSSATERRSLSAEQAAEPKAIDQWPAAVWTTLSKHTPFCQPQRGPISYEVGDKDSQSALGGEPSWVPVGAHSRRVPPRAAKARSLEMTKETPDLSISACLVRPTGRARNPEDAVCRRTRHP
jgi:hypothetical protein